MKRTALLALLLLGGCVSFNARAQVGPTADTGGRGGVSAMVMAGFGWTGDRSAAFWAAGAESDKRVASSVDVVRSNGDDWGVRAGAHSVAGDQRTSFGFHSALLYPLTSMDDDLEKRKAHVFFGVETRAGVLVPDRMEPQQATEAEVGAALSLELLYKFDDAM